MFNEARLGISRVLSLILCQLKETCKQPLILETRLQRYVYPLSWLTGCLLLALICHELEQDMVADGGKYLFTTDIGKFVLGVTLSASYCYMGGKFFEWREAFRAHLRKNQATDAKKGDSFEHSSEDVPHVNMLVSGDSCFYEEVVSLGGAHGTGLVASHTNFNFSQMPPKRLASLVHKKQAIRWAVKAGEQERAERLLYEIIESGFAPDLRIFNLVISGSVKRGDIARAEIWFMHMRKVGVTPNSASYNMIMDAHGKAENAKGAERWFADMIDEGQAPDAVTYATMIHAHAKHGDTKLAEKWLWQMIGAGLTPNVISYNSLILSCSRNGDVDGAEKWAYEAEKADLNAKMVEVYAKHDDNDDECHAQRRADKMTSSKADPNVVTYSTMIDACAKAGDRVRAEFWHRRMLARGLQPNAHTFSSVISACAKAGDAVAASQHLMMMEKAQVRSDVVVYSSVLNACAKAGDTKRAKKVFQQMQSSGIQPNLIAYSSLAQSLAYRGDWMEVENLGNMMTNEGYVMNDRFLCALLLSYALAFPRQAQRAEAAFVDACAKGVPLNTHILAALRRAVGKARCKQLFLARDQMPQQASNMQQHQQPAEWARQSGTMQIGHPVEPTEQEDGEFCQHLWRSSSQQQSTATSGFQ